MGATLPSTTIEHIAAASSLADLAAAIFDGLHGCLPCDCLVAALLDRTGDRLDWAAHPSHEASEAPRSLPVAGSGLANFLQTGQAGTLDHRADSPLFPGGMGSFLVVPLRSDRAPLGVLILGSRAPNVYHAKDADRLRGLTAALRLWMERAQLARALEARAQVEQQKEYLKDEIQAEQSFTSLIGDGPAMQSVRRAILQVAKTDSTVLILGETGTGKELIARAIHKISPRRQHLLVKLNCAALASGVIASELFGHEAGAFTGALKARRGRFEIAQKGSLFLDEVGEIPPDIQVMLLRVLQERVIERVGGNEPVPVDVRIIAATHQDLAAAVRDGRFRADLYYRLNVFPLRVPPLRERKEDIPALVTHFVRHFAGRLNRPAVRVSSATMNLLTGYSWPGNVRELENLLERALIVASGDDLRIDPTWLSVPLPAPEQASSLADVERQAIVQALERCGGKIHGPAGAAQALGLKPSTLYGKMRKFHIERP
jgi:formate hydrogenlyase transcriptional activator